MKALAFTRLLGLAAALVIFNQESASLGPWVLNEEQRDVLQQLCDHQRVLVLKGRQVGVSTLCCLYDLAFAIANPGVGVVICADVQDNANALLKKISGWCVDLGIKPTVDNVESLVLPNGSYIDAKSAVAPAEGKESRVGRSRSYLLFHITELGFWANDAAVFGSLTSGATSPHVRMVIESTASAADNLFKAMWETPEEKNGWRHVWLSIERHSTYRLDADTVDDATWEHLQGLGFTHRESGAWWWDQVKAKFNGDARRASREYPVRPEDCFAFAEGRWLAEWKPASPRYAGVWSDDDSPIYRGWTYYADSGAEKTVAGVDVGAGLGRDASTIAIKTEKTRRLVATFTDNTISIPDFEKLIESTSTLFRCRSVRVEKNGVGEGVVQHLAANTQVPLVIQTSNAGEKHERMTKLKLAIESHAMPIGEEVIAEARSSRISRPDGPRGSPVYEGRDDLLNALSFVDKEIEELGKPKPPAPPKPDVREVFVPPRARSKARTW